MTTRPYSRNQRCVRRITLALVALLVVGPVCAVEPPVEIVGRVVVPVPREVFGALDQLGPVNWGGEVRKVEYGDLNDRYAAAMVFGVAIAEGFIAVQARDAEATRRLGPLVLEISDLLGVREAVASHAAAIIDAAEESHWDEVRRELDRTQGTVRETMEKMRDEHLAQFVSMGGWFRGTEAAAGAILADFSIEKAELLHQPGLVAHFRTVVESLEGAAAGRPVMVSVRESLPGLKGMMERPALTRDDISAIHALCADLVGTVLNGAPGPSVGEEETP